MRVLLKKDFTIELRSVGKVINVNDSMVSRLEVEVEENFLLPGERLWVVFSKTKDNPTDDITKEIQLGTDNKTYSVAIPQGVVMQEGTWYFILSARKYYSEEKYFTRKATAPYEFTVEGGLWIDEATSEVVNNGTAQSLYKMAADKIAIEQENAKDIVALQEKADKAAASITDLQGMDAAISETANTALEKANKAEEDINKAEEDILQLQIDVGPLMPLPAIISDFKEEIKNTTASDIEVSVDPNTFIATFVLLGSTGTPISSAKIDLPLESVVVGGKFDESTKNVVLTLQNESTVSFSVADLVDGLISSSEKGAPNGVATLDENGKVPKEQVNNSFDRPISVGGSPAAHGVTITESPAQVEVRENWSTDGIETNYAAGYVRNGIREFDYENYRDVITTGTFYFPKKQGKQILATVSDLQSYETKIALHNQIIAQSGLVYTADDVNTWNEQVTADGLNVLDGSKAVLKKVVGSTVACRNLVDIPFIDGTTKQQEYAVNFGQDIFVSVGELPTVSSSIWRFRFVYKDGTSFYATDLELEKGGKKISATADNPIVKIEYRGDYVTEGRYSKIMIAYGDTATEYQPYFTGLKSASFGGIESTNADGTETSTLAFPKTETPLGTTIDFESGKITEYGVDLVLNGTEGISYYSSSSIDGSIVFGGLGGDEVNPIGVCTDGELGDSQEYGKIRINFGSIYWYGILDKLGYTNDSNGANQFKAYLSQRYADGNPVKIRYVSSTLQSETDFTADNEYTAYKSGTEKMLENDGNEYGADNTLTTNYLFVSEVKQ